MNFDYSKINVSITHSNNISNNFINKNMQLCQVDVGCNNKAEYYAVCENDNRNYSIYICQQHARNLYDKIYREL